jgi:hypothetical protein
MMTLPRGLLGLLPFVAIAAGAEEPRSVLVLHFDEGEGIVAHDASGGGHEGRIIGAMWTDGQAGRALRFTGAGRVDLGRPADLEFGKTQDFTLDLWLRVPTDAKPDFAFILTNRLRLEDTPGYTLFLNRGFQACAAVGDKVNWIDLLTAPQALNDGQWHRLTLTCDRDGLASLYLDGALRQQSSMVGLVTVSNGELPVLVGSRGHSGDFVGDLDEVVLWKGLKAP